MKFNKTKQFNPEYLLLIISTNYNNNKSSMVFKGITWYWRTNANIRYVSYIYGLTQIKLKAESTNGGGHAHVLDTRSQIKHFVGGPRIIQS